MRILFTDETNMNPGRDATFFIYGGLFLPIETIPALHDGIEQIRDQLGYGPADELKFETNSRPEGVSVADWTPAKRDVVALCRESDCQFIAYVALHAIVQGQTQQNRVLWAADHVLGRFNRYLTEVDDIGIVAVDNLPINAQFRYLSDKFSVGLTVDNRTVQLDRIKLFSATCSNASHISSAMDIVLGSFRYCVNNPRNPDAAREMMSNVVRLMWHTRDGDTFHVHNKGLVCRPLIENIRVEAYKQQYTDMIDNFNQLLADDE